MKQPIDFLVIILLGVATVCAQAILVSGPIAKGLTATVQKLPGIVKTAHAKMSKGLHQHIEGALSPLVANTPAEQVVGMLVEAILPVLNTCIGTVAGLLDVRKMTPSFMQRPALIAVAMGIFITGVLVAFVFPILTNFIQFNVGIFSIAVLVIHLVLFILAWNAHR